MILQINGKLYIFNIKKRNNSKYVNIWNAKYGKSLNIKKINPKTKILNYIK
jgi:hypothetical protein